MTLQIVILAMIAAFLGLRLYSVLGRRAEHEEEPIPGRIEDQKQGRPPVSERSVTRPGQSTPLPRSAGGVTAVERGIREIAAVDRRFDTIAFVDGARGAYRMILEAFWRGDKEELAQLCDRDVYEGFVAAIDARTAAGETLDNRLVRIEDTTIVSAMLDDQTARIAVRFTADIAAVTRNADGQVIAGSLNDAVEANDIWTFSRNVNSASPDWLLDETDEA